jgi:predicted ATP-dependent protease
MATALTSLYTGLPARGDTAMTGEITPTGLVLPIGGVKETVLTARRAGMKRVILPRANQKDLREVPEEARKELEFIFADHIENVLCACERERKRGRHAPTARAALRDTGSAKTRAGRHRRPGQPHWGWPAKMAPPSEVALRMFSAVLCGPFP